MSKSNDLSRTITDQIIEAIESGLTDTNWVRPWSVFTGMPINPSTGKEYRGMNALLLMMIGGGNFSGYGQWKKLGAQVRKGSKHIKILAPMMVNSKTEFDLSGNPKKVLIGFSDAKVFAASDVDGWTPPALELNEDFTPHQAAEERIQAVIDMGCDYQLGGDVACFIPSQDVVKMPTKGQFPDEVDYYTTAMHELVHWTGGADRLNRRKTNADKFQTSNPYAFEELVAELGASFLAAELGIHMGIRKDHLQYIGHWLEIMRGDDKAIMAAASQAATAVDVIMGRADLKGKQVKKDTALAA